MDCLKCKGELIPAPTGYEIEMWHCPKCDTFYGIDEKGDVKLMRRSPGANWIAACIGMTLAGRKFDNKKEAREAFIQAVKDCAGK